MGGGCLCAFFPGFGFSDFRCRAHDRDRGEPFGVVECEFHGYAAGDGDAGEVDAAFRRLVGDERGGREDNLALGQKRSEAVRRALGLLGVSDGQMEAVSYGKEKPAAQGNDEAAWSKNRRVEFTYR